MSQKLNIIKWFFIICFGGIVLYLLFFYFSQGKYVYSNPYNQRLRSQNTYIVRGDIKDRNGTILASSLVTDDSITRKYEYGQHFSHIIGYHSEKIGSTGIEALYDKELSSASIIDILKNKTNQKQTKGNTIKLTIDKELQVYASKLLENKKGALVAINPKTGELLALVSKPDFNPTDVDTNWNKLIENENSPLLNRALDGLYTPGSIFKIITASAALDYNLSDLEMDCTGSINVDGYEIKDSEASGHGVTNLSKGFTMSCNSYFVSLGLKIGNERMYSEAMKYKFNTRISKYIISKNSSYIKKDNNKSLAQQSIGQGDILITPIHAATIAATIANGGTFLPPYMVSEIINMNGKSIRNHKSSIGNRIIDSYKAETIKNMMVDVVKSGTGESARIKGIDVAGKTGTAENPHGEPHSWFIGFAPAENPQIAISVIIENGGSGGSVAAPIARKVMKKALENTK